MKILNCITNSFFRTIGRILAYLAIGALLVTLLSKADLPSFDEIINDTLFMRVNASTYQSQTISTPAIKDINGNVIDNMNLSGGWYYSKNISASNTSFIIDFNEAYDISNAENILLNLSLLIEAGSNQVSQSTTCTFSQTYERDKMDIYYEPSNGGSLYDWGEVQFDRYYPTNLSCTTSDIQNDRNYNFSINVAYTYNNSDLVYTPCYITGTNGSSYSMICPVTSTTIDGLRIGIVTDNNTENYKLGLYPVFSKAYSDSSAIINNNNQNTQQIIQNQQAQTNATIENQNQNTQQQIESQQICNYIDKSNITINNKSLNQNNGNINNYDSPGYGITDYININKGNIILKSKENWAITFCFYNVNKEYITCSNTEDININENIKIPENAVYFRSNIWISTNKPTYNICQNGNQALSNSLNDTNVSDSTNQADSFFSNFSTADQGGLSGIITAPLSAIQSLTSSTCSPLVIPLPYIDENLTLPCMRSIYESFFGNFIYLYDTITIGIISYWVIVRIFNLVKDFKNPDHDEIEVLDL